MKLYLYETEVMRQKGSALRGMIRNSSTPILDLLVRESIQNSLDANDHQSRASFVNVEYITGHFKKELLDQELDGISLATREDWSNTFIAISDSGTTGLTGRYDDDDANLCKLVFGILEPQRASGSGGCWGVGKTVYFRIGTGMVIYYSRIKTEDGGYDSLMSVAFVEDETRNDTLLPAAGDQKKYGLAWWGDPVPGKKRVRETHDSEVIGRVLDTFGITPYEKRPGGTHTGTTIIIPFTDEKKLLANNLQEREDGRPAPYWTSSIPEYLKYSVQKWYSARLCNRKCQFGKRLNVTINGEIFDPGRDMIPFFGLAQALYNKAALSITGSQDAEGIRFGDAEIHCKEVLINSFIRPRVAGYVAFAKVGRRELGMLPPDNMPGPYELIHSEVRTDDPGEPIVLYCRKPGMIVSYELGVKWDTRIPKTGEDEFLVAFFVLNSEPSLMMNGAALKTDRGNDVTLEDYVQKSEQADHMSWNDYCLLDFNYTPKIISKIKGNSAKAILSVLQEEEDDLDRTADTGLSNRLGALLLPGIGFGRKPTAPRKTDGNGGNAGGGGGNGGGGSSRSRGVKFSFVITGFTAEGLVLSIHATTGKKTSSGFSVDIDADSIKGSISAQKWMEEMGIDFPFSISAIRADITRLDGKTEPQSFSFGPDSHDSSGPVSIEKHSNRSADWYGFTFQFSDEKDHSFDVELILDVTVHRRDIRPSLSFE